MILTVKSQDTDNALHDLQAGNAAQATIVCCQNGVDNQRKAARGFERLYGIVAWIVTGYLEPGVILLESRPIAGILDAGCFPKGTDATINRVLADLRDCGFTAEPDAQIMRAKYAKLLANLNNAIQAICGIDAVGGELSGAVTREALQCYAAAGIDFVPSEETREMNRQRSTPGSLSVEYLNKLLSKDPHKRGNVGREWPVTARTA